MLEKLRNKAQELIQTDKDKYELIANILKEDNCFKLMDMDTAYSILEDLGIQNKNKVYLELMKGK